ncbi:hypothetical protein FISHEDRAFT_11818, partial [Fistulina hepatica ATCC 64428]
QVKKCYICSQVEKYGEPPTHTRKWVNPCKCNRIAHEYCFTTTLIASLYEARTAHERRDVYRCRTCGFRYRLTAFSPPWRKILLKIDNTLITLTSIFERIMVIGTRGAGTAAAPVILCLLIPLISGVYMCLTLYGRWALQSFLGEETFNLVLSGDPAQWPSSAFVRLPLIPLNLVLSYLFRPFPLTLPSFILWPDIPMLAPSFFSIMRPHEMAVWPPSLALCSFLLPFVRYTYGRLQWRVQRYVLGAFYPPPSAGSASRLMRILFGDGALLGDNANADAGDGEAEQMPVVMAERALGGTLFTMCGMALMTPLIAQASGRMLWHIAQSVPSLHTFLGIRPPSSPFPLAIPCSPSFGKASQFAARMFGRVFFGGCWPWSELDPVWWRNLVGLGIYTVVKDACAILHLQLKTRNLASLRVESFDFSGLPRDRLDLIPQPQE